MPTIITKTCEICGRPFDVVLMKKKQKTCLATECRFKQKSRISSELMTQRRNGGDPALNAKLAKACGAHLKKMWDDPDFRAARIEQATEHLAEYMSDPVAVAKRDAKMRKVLQRAHKRLRAETEFSELLSETVRRYMQEDPYMQRDEREYQDYLSEMMSRALTDKTFRAYVDAKASAIWTEEHARERAKSTPSAPPGGKS